MFCEKCGSDMNNNPVCSNCGWVSTADKNLADPVNYQSASPAGYVRNNPAESPALFVSPDEIPLFSMKNGSLDSVALGQGIGKDDVVISSKRLYYTSKRGTINKTISEEVVNLEDITGTKIMVYSPKIFLILFIICVLFAFNIIRLNYDTLPVWPILLDTFVAFVFVALYFYYKRASSCFLKY